MKRFLLLIVCCSLFLAGCGGKGVSFTGVVKNADGSPCSGVIVNFTDTRYKYDGTTDANGKYKLTGATMQDGIEPGMYRVSIVRNDGDSIRLLSTVNDSSSSVFGIDHCPHCGQKITQNALICEVKGSGTFDITLEE